jgi:hypothetical protein
MTTLQTAITNGILKIQSQLGSRTFVCDGEEHVAIITNISEVQINRLGGLDAIPDQTIKVLKSSFTDGIYPQNLHQITVDGYTYKITKVTTDTTNTFLVLNCSSVNRGNRI